jgi:type II secretory pathway pseudopilin PulG
MILMNIPKRPSRGFALLEVIVSVVVGTLVLAFLVRPLSAALINRLQSDQIAQATELAQEQVELVRRTWREDASLMPSYGSDETIPFQSIATDERTGILNDANLVPVDHPGIQSVGIDQNQDGKADFILQSFAGKSPNLTEVGAQTQRSVVRVYKAPLRPEDSPTPLALMVNDIYVGRS